jgi:carbon monoxide dehydrogenase subunit G
LRIENAFDVLADPEVAWRLLNDVPLVVPCMPGAELTDVVDDSTFNVLMTVKLGAVALRLLCVVRRESSNDSTQVTVLTVSARDEKGRGGATARIESSLQPVNAATRVSLVTDLRLQGTIASISRGIVAAVASEVVARFADRLAEEMKKDSFHSASPGEAMSDARVGRSGASPAEPGAVGGFGLVLRAFWRRLLGR